MTSGLADPGAVQGAQTPRISCVPAYRESAGDEAIELAELAGLYLDPWQQAVLRDALGERPDGTWAALEVGLVLPRQNGKNAVLEARQLAGLFLLEEELQIHSAHLFSTSMEAFRRLEQLVRSAPELMAQVANIPKSHGSEGIELKNGQRILFKTRTKGGGRGFTADAVYLDEAYELSEDFHAALTPALSAVPNPQIWYTSSAVNQLTHENGIVLARTRERGIAGASGRLLYDEWSVDEAMVAADAPLDDLALWAQANPGLGIRLGVDWVREVEFEGMGRRQFLTERLGVGDWPITTGVEHIFAPGDLAACFDEDSQPQGDLHFTFDASPDRRHATIGAAGMRADGLPHIEAIASAPGLDWLVGRMVELVEKHGAASVSCDAKSPAASLIPALAAKGIEVTTTSTDEHARACGLLMDAVTQHKVRWSDPDGLVPAMRGAAKRPLGDTWAWSRKTSESDISPLVACTLALWAASQHKVEVRPWGAFG